MKYQFFLSCLAAAGLACGRVLPANVRSTNIESRSIGAGWSLQAQTCPASSTSCGNGSCCPSSLHCVSATMDEVAACCPTASSCKGTIEGAPTCADSSWSLWKGLQGNGFCCTVGLVGVYDSRSNVAGSCVQAAGAGATPAILMSAGSGSAQSPQPALVPAPTPSTSSNPSPSAIGNATGSVGKPVFFHYMIGTITDAHCEQDILDAQALGADAFALNLNTDTATYATTTVSQLFKWAAVHNFKLFFSFDMTGFSNPSQFLDFLKSYVSNGAYYKYNGLPLVSTFNGGTSSFTFGQSSVSAGWKAALQQPMASAGTPIFFVPAFQDAPNGGQNFFTTYPTLDGAMNWNSWPQNTQGKIVVPTTDDVAYQSSAQANGKKFLMGVSPLQFKHLDSGDNYYRRGEQNLEERFGQVLSLQPDFIELQTWNDAGESHYMGNSWPEPIEDSVIPAYSAAYDHTGYWQILPAFIKAYKAGSTDTSTMFPTTTAQAQGVIWHHTLLTTADCSADPMGKPQGADTIEDKVTAAVLVAAGTTNLRLDISSGGTSLGGTTLKPGYNKFSVSGLTTGTVTATVSTTGGQKVLTATGPLPVVSKSNLCNYNFQVVALK